MKHSIEIINGNFLNLLDPKAADLTVEAVAWGISRQPRFAGHTLGPIPYSVAQHSVLVAETLVRAFKKSDALHQLALEIFRDDEAASILLKYADTKAVLLGAVLGLFHDGSEGFVCDLPTPVKSIPGFKEAYCEIETRLQRAIHELIGVNLDEVPSSLLRILRWADLYALGREARFLVPSGGKTWSHLPRILPEDDAPFEVLSAENAYNQFLTYYKLILRA